MKAWAKGDRVSQATYGPGTLVEVNEHHTVIEFDEHGRRTFATRIVVLQSTNEPAPAKSPRKRAAKAKPKESKEAKAPKEAKAKKEPKAPKPAKAPKEAKASKSK